MGVVQKNMCLKRVVFHKMYHKSGEFPRSNPYMLIFKLNLHNNMVTVPQCSPNLNNFQEL